MHLSNRNQTEPKVERCGPPVNLLVWAFVRLFRSPASCGLFKIPAQLCYFWLWPSNTAQDKTLNLIDSKIQWHTVNTAPPHPKEKKKKAKMWHHLPGTLEDRTCCSGSLTPALIRASSCAVNAVLVRLEAPVCQPRPPPPSQTVWHRCHPTCSNLEWQMSCSVSSKQCGQAARLSSKHSIQLTREQRADWSLPMASKRRCGTGRGRDRWQTSGRRKEV